MLLSPFKVLRRSAGAALVPGIPIVCLLLYIVAMRGVTDPTAMMLTTDSYLGGNMYLAAADLTAYNNLSTNMQMPIIRLGGIAEKSNFMSFMDGRSDITEFMFTFLVLFLGFLSYAMICRVIYSSLKGSPEMFGGKGITPASLALSAIAAFLMLFFASFYLGGLKLLVVISFGIYFTFAMPFAALGMPLGESMFRGFKFVGSGMSSMIICYIGCMGAAVMVPVALWIFLSPLVVNLPASQAAVGTLLKVFLGLFSVVFALFYQMALCAEVAYAAAAKEEHAS